MQVIEDKETFYKFFTPQNANKPEIHGGFALRALEQLGQGGGADQGRPEGDDPVHSV